jgi:hypothetical protein
VSATVDLGSTNLYIAYVPTQRGKEEEKKEGKGGGRICSVSRHHKNSDHENRDLIAIA